MKKFKIIALETKKLTYYVDCLTEEEAKEEIMSGNIDVFEEESEEVEIIKIKEVE